MRPFVVPAWRTLKALPGLSAAALLLAACGGGDTDRNSAVDADRAAAVVPSAGSPRALQTQPALGSAPLRGAPTQPALGVARPLAATEGGAQWRIDSTQREAVQLFYRAVYAASSNVSAQWTGSVDTCTAGDTSADYKAAVLRRVNWWRAMAGVPAAVQLDPVYNQGAQQAALMMAANSQLSHTPPSSWRCWTAGGAEAAANSNLVLGTAGDLIDWYVADQGANNAAVGHRRWLFYPQTKRMGTGDVQGWSSAPGSVANALWILDDASGQARPATRDGFVAWPAPGYVPHSLVYPRWSLSFPEADFANARVTVSENGRPVETVMEDRSTGIGENTLVWFVGATRDGMDWPAPLADTRYDVVVAGVRVGGQAREFRYTVSVFDANAPVSWSAAPQALAGTTLQVSAATQGRPTLPAGQSATFGAPAVQGASRYQWRSVALLPLVFNDGAENGLGSSAAALVADTSPGYEVVASGAVTEGRFAYHLTHVRPLDQTLTLRPTVVPRATSVLQFSSRLGWAGSGQSALVEASVDQGRTWTELYRQVGSGGAGERGFVTRRLPLAALAQRTVQLRFRFAKPQGSYFPQTDNDVGWWIDDIRVSDADTPGVPVEQAALVESVQPSQALTLPAEGRWLVQARPGMFGLWADWGRALELDVTPSPLAKADCLLNWGERLYPELLQPRAATQALAPYLYRAYAGGVYVGLSSADSRLYLLRNTVLEDLGPLERWAPLAGC